MSTSTAFGNKSLPTVATRRDCDGYPESRWLLCAVNRHGLCSCEGLSGVVWQPGASRPMKEKGEAVLLAGVFLLKAALAANVGLLVPITIPLMMGVAAL